ncbi:MAG: ribosome maturation factor RimP [Deltaproteobacteria bacterium]|jgi:ribosome maturation factor RimP|nr:ribosome maturation factor RimP [Deltaproteobacteria bacterium]
MDSKEIVKKVEALLTPVLENLGYDLIEQEFMMGQGGWILRLYIDKDGGVNVDDCARVSRSVEDLIEVEEVIPVKYFLEVSSPGLNRPLRRKKDFEKFVGSLIKLKTTSPIDGRSNYKGYLTAVDGVDVVMSVDGSEYRVPLEKLLRANIEEMAGSDGQAIN